MTQQEFDVRRAWTLFYVKIGIIAFFMIAALTVIGIMAIDSMYPPAPEKVEELPKKEQTNLIDLGPIGSTIAVIGDSHVGGLRPSLKKLLGINQIGGRGYQLEFKDLKSTSVRYWQQNPELFPWLKSKQPQTVFIVLGTNDAMARNEVETRKAAFQRFVDQIRGTVNPPPTVVWLLPPKLTNSVLYLDGVRQAVDQLHGATPVDLAELIVPLKNYAHPNKDGYAIWARTVNERLRSQ